MKNERLHGALMALKKALEQSAGRIPEKVGEAFFDLLLAFDADVEPGDDVALPCAVCGARAVGVSKGGWNEIFCKTPGAIPEPSDYHYRTPLCLTPRAAMKNWNDAQRGKTADTGEMRLRDVK